MYICVINYMLQRNNMSQIEDEKLPDTLTPSTPLLSEGTTLLPPVWGRLVHRRVFLTTIDLRNNCYKFGRNPNCDISVSLRNMARLIMKLTSKEHFIISKDITNIPYIKDLSRNGTFLNGDIIGKGNMASLRDGDIIAVGAKVHEVYQFRDEPTNFISQEFDSKYRITRLIGKGAFGEVFLAISKKNSYRYAVKKIEVTGRDESKVTNEIKIMDSLEHPCVIRMYEAIYAHQHVYIILEYMEGGELQSRVLQKGMLKESVAKFYIYQIALAVQYLHNCGITHRDLKPQNVLLKTKESNSIIKVTDFGMSKIVGHSSVMHSLCGTPLYVAPEILIVDGKTSCYTPQVDVWSLGCITYFTLFGKTPFQSSLDAEVIPESDYLKRLYNSIIKGEFVIPTEQCENRDTKLCDKYLASDSAVELIKLMLTNDPKKRITINGILSHEWFQDEAMKINVKNLFSK